MNAQGRRQPLTATAGRLNFLDGLRGWAALSVVIYHTSWETFGIAAPWIRIRALSLVNDGTLAVYIFFVLSGVVLSQPLLRAGSGERVAKMALSRYPRLAIPVAAASAIALVMMMAGLLFNRAAAVIVERQDWMGQFFLQVPTAYSFIRFATFDVFFNYKLSGSYGPFLWTMPIELAGSFLLFAAFGIFGRNARSRYLAYTAGACVAWRLDLYIVTFVLGAAISEFMSRSVQSRHARAKDAAGLCLFCIACLGSALFRDHYSVHRCAILATVLVLAVVLSPRLQWLLELRLSRWLGHISFPLYLVHAFVLFGPSSWAIVHLQAIGTPQTSIMAAVIPGTIALSLAAAWLFSPVERLAISASHRFANFVIAGQSGTVPFAWPAAASELWSLPTKTILSLRHAAARRRGPPGISPPGERVPHHASRSLETRTSNDLNGG